MNTNATDNTNGSQREWEKYVRECLRNHVRPVSGETREHAEEYHKRHEEQVRARVQKNVEENKKKNKALAQKMYKESCDKKKVYRRNYYHKNRDKKRAYDREHYQKNREKALAYAKKWRDNNPKKVRASLRKSQAKRLADPKVRLSHNVSCCMGQSLHGNKNGCHWETLVGYTLDDLKKHLEKQFTAGMSWENYGEWHLDHRTPVSAFNFADSSHEDFKRCWSLSNLQPLWAKENISKGAKMEAPHQPSLALTPIAG